MGCIWIFSVLTTLPVAAASVFARPPVALSEAAHCGSCVMAAVTADALPVCARPI